MNSVTCKTNNDINNFTHFVNGDTMVFLYELSHCLYLFTSPYSKESLMLSMQFQSMFNHLFTCCSLFHTWPYLT